MYAALCASIAGVGRLSINEKSEIKNRLRAMIEKDPVGAQEFNVDPWMLLQQDVVHDPGESGLE